MKIGVLRLGHRIKRDKRITTHVFLVARAFGAGLGILTGEKDESILESVRDVVDRWGGSFKVRYEESWKEVIKNWKGKVIHLTMYGLPIQEEIKKVRECKENLLIVVGGRKVPGEVYKLVDYNISVTQQPHSEVAALGVFLDRYHQGEELKREFENAKIKIAPQSQGKKTIENGEETRDD